MKKILTYKKTIVATATGLFLGILFIKYPAPADRILNIQNYLITVGGIISAFVIAYLSAKIFNIKSERESRQIEIDKYSEKLTNYRRLLYYVMTSHEFWTHYNDIAVMKRKYPGLTYAKLHANSLDEQAKTAWNDGEISVSTLDLYYAMMDIYGDPDMRTGSAWALDKAASFNYTIDDLIKFYEPSNAIWYYLEGRYAKHGVGRFTDNGLNPLWKGYVKDLLPRIDSKFKSADFHREVLAAIGTEFYEYIIPKLIGLIRRNTGVPKIVLKTFYSLIAIMAFGVVLPIAIQSMSIPDNLNISLTLSCVVLTIIAIVVFMLDFLDFINDDVHIVKPKQTT